jgi:NADH-quinone oxidoreductase subunit A
MTPPLYWPLVLYATLVVVVVAGTVLLSWVLGSRRKDVAVRWPFEAGLSPIRPTGPQSSIRFYLLALFFVVFDVQSVFLFAWAVSWRATGWPGYAAAAVFAGTLIAALVYLWSRGALDWNRR